MEEENLLTPYNVGRDVTCQSHENGKQIPGPFPKPAVPLQRVVSRGWSSLSQPTQLSAHSGGLDLGGEPNRVCHSKGINVRLRHVDSILPVGIT